MATFRKLDVYWRKVAVIPLLSHNILHAMLDINKKYSYKVYIFTDPSSWTNTLLMSVQKLQ